MRKRLRGKTPFVVCAVAVLLAAAIFTCRLADWQLIHGAEYKRLSTRSTSFNVDTQPTRGEILDCNGAGLVTNITHYKIVIDKLYADEKNPRQNPAQPDGHFEKYGKQVQRRASDNHS